MLNNLTKLSQCLLVGALVYTPLYAAELSLSQEPLLVTEYVEPNVMLLLDTSGSMGTLQNGETRLQIMKDIATDLVQDNEDIRFCLARFRFDQGGTILSECGSSNANIQEIVNNIAALPSYGSTPLAEAYYEVINYFGGKTPKYRGVGISLNDNNIYVPLADDKYVSPIQYRCQKNYTIVLTDGTPQLDTYFPDFPTIDRNYPNLNTYYSPSNSPDGNYDGVDNDGATTYDEQRWGVYSFLDDMAKYAWDTDLRDSGTDLTGASFNDVDFLVQNLNTYTVGFTLDIDMLRDAADYGNGGDGSGDFDGDGDVDADDAANDHYYSAGDRAELTAAFQTAIEQIINENRTTTEATASSDLLASDTLVFQTKFTSNEWTGELIAYQFETDTAGNYSLTEEWVAPAAFPDDWEERVVYTGLYGGIPLKWTNLSSAQKTQWFGGTANEHKQRFNYMRGRTATAIAALGFSDYRSRVSLMGDVVNSSPVYVAPPEAGVYANTDLSTSYDDFVADYNTSGSERDAMIYLGANDGFLHAFDLQGNEKMVFAPSQVLPNMLAYSAEEYSHQFYVDGSPTAADVYAEFNGAVKSWRTVLVGGLRRGGQGIYALDITDPSRFADGSNAENNSRAQSTFLWEFSDDVTGAATAGDKYNGDADLGYTYSEPQIMRLNDGEFYVVLGNGYNSTQADGHASGSGDAVLYLLNIASGEVFKKISTDTGMSEDPNSGSLGNGLATVTGFDGGKLNSYGEVEGDEDGKVDFIYAGDLFGNIWKFDVSSSDTDDWDYVPQLDTAGEVAEDRNPVRLFSAQDSDANAQAVTSQLEVRRLYDGEIMLYFGTGKLLEQTDTQVVNINTQTFYAIGDYNYKLSRSDLLLQSIYLQEDVDFDGVSKEVRLTTDYTRESEKGWFMDMKKPVYNNTGDLSYELEGEQIVVGAQFIDNYIYFVTSFSNQDACVTSDEKNFLMILSARSGAALKDTVIDTNGDGVIDDADNVTLANGTVATVSGRTGFGVQIPIIIKTGVVAADGAEESVICDANNNCQVMASPAKEWNRRSWKELRTD